MPNYPLASILGTRSVATDLAILSLAVTIGMTIGAISFRNLKLGVSGVLFASLVFGQIGFTIEPKVLDFLRNFALIIFMYAMGLQVGPGFGASLRAEGVRLNTLTLCVIVLGAAMTAAIARWIPTSMGPGLFSGAFTTTPGLAAAQEAMRGSRSIYDDASAPARTGLAYSITYPFGVVGPMFVVVALRVMFRVRVADESAALVAAEERSHPHIEIVDLEVTAAEYAGTSLREHPLLKGKEIVFTRLLREARWSFRRPTRSCRLATSIAPSGRVVIFRL